MSHLRSHSRAISPTLHQRWMDRRKRDMSCSTGAATAPWLGSAAAAHRKKSFSKQPGHAASCTAVSLQAACSTRQSELCCYTKRSTHRCEIPSFVCNASDTYKNYLEWSSIQLTSHINSVDCIPAHECGEMRGPCPSLGSFNLPPRYE
jgi:hypothetical protein